MILDDRNFWQGVSEPFLFALNLLMSSVATALRRKGVLEGHGCMHDHRLVVLRRKTQ